MFRNFIILLAALLSNTANAESFDACPADAYLSQGKPARLYGVDLATGAYDLLATDLGTRDKLNAIAFNYHDNYLYAWGYDDDTIVKIGRDYKIQPLKLLDRPNSDYYVGDIGVKENAYYFYRRGGGPQHGLWRASLDPADGDYLRAIRIASGQQMSLKIFDFAFHPDNGQLYSVDADGRLLEIDPYSASYRSLGNVGEKGTFGAVYFDVTGFLYVSRNKDGKIFRIDPAASQPIATEYAQGPASSNNDGGRCAMAPVADADSLSVDFGDAPESYSTSLANNGPRHGISDTPLFLGDSIDHETQAFIYPLSDNDTDLDDEDGVEFITAFTIGNQAIIQVKATGEGYLSGWIDFDRDGQFGNLDQIIHDTRLNNETKSLVIDIPVNAVSGNTWARFRFSSNGGLGPIGGVADGEVEDYQIELSGGLVSVSYYPSIDNFVTIAFEDLWPSSGDYDLNDLVVHYRTGIKTIGEKVIGVSISGQMLAIGATFHNGFGIDIPGVSRENIDPASIEFVINGLEQKNSPLEKGQSNAVFIVTDDIWNYVTPAEGCSFYRTENNCGDSPVQASFLITAELRSPVDKSTFTDSLFNPFLFASEGFPRNSIFAESPGRGLEIHLKNRPPTDLADPSLLGRADDRSDPSNGLYYQNEAGLPWAVEIGTEWKHPAEYQDVVQTYPEFGPWVQSNGKKGSDWYRLENSVKEKLYRNGE